MSCLLIVLEGFSAAALTNAKASGRLSRWHDLAACGLLGELAFPLSEARVATLVSAITGTWPDQHGILMARTRDAANTGWRPMQPVDRAQPTAWEPLDAHGIDCISVGWPLAITGCTTRSAIVECGFGVTPSPEFKPNLASMVSPTRLTDPLADCWYRPDEFNAESIAPLVPNWKIVDQSVDNRLGILSAVLAENVSRHSAFVRLLDTEPWQFATLCLSLPAELASLSRASASLGDDLFTDLQERGLPLLNDFLNEILRRVPTDTDLVIAGLPVAGAAVHPGFFLLQGPTFSKTNRPLQANLLELVPLIWSACGYQTVGTMPGRGLLPSIRAGHTQRVFDRSWQPPTGHQLTRLENLLEVKQPYTPIKDMFRPEETLHLDSLSVLGRSLMAHQEALRALPVLHALTRLVPSDSRAWLQLCDCQQILGLMRESLNSAYTALDYRNKNDPAPHLQAATLEVICGQPEAARALLAQAYPQITEDSPRQLQYARILIFLRDWPAALAKLEDIVKSTPPSARALRFLARCHLAQQTWQEAFDCAIESLKLDPAHHRTHEILAYALLGLGMRNQAWQAFESAIDAAPTWPRPRAALTMLARRMGKPKDQIDHYLASYQKVKQESQEKRDALQDAARKLSQNYRFE